MFHSIQFCLILFTFIDMELNVLPWPADTLTSQGLLKPLDTPSEQCTNISLSDVWLCFGAVRP